MAIAERVLAESAVEGRGREAVPRQDELERRDVPAHGAPLEGAASEHVLPVTAKREAGLRSG